MHNAPSVLYPVGRCRLYGLLLVCAGGLGVALWAYWWSLIPAHAARGSGAWTAPLPMAWLGAGLWLLWAAFAAHSWRRMPVGWLHWNARAGLQAGAGEWRWCSAAHEDGAPLHRVALVLDLQSLALLCLRNPAAAQRWVWVEARRDPARWHDLRRALRAAHA